MNKLRVGIIGLGFVGGSILKSFKLKKCLVKGYDLNKDSDTFSDTMESDIVFLCLPTIYNQEKKEYDKSSIMSICNDLSNNKFINNRQFLSIPEIDSMPNEDEKYKNWPKGASVLYYNKVLQIFFQPFRHCAVDNF